MKRLLKNMFGEITDQSFSPIMKITKIYQCQNFSCLYTFHSSSKTEFLLKEALKSPSALNFFTPNSELEINLSIDIHNQLKKVWNVNCGARKSLLNYFRTIYVKYII